MSLLTSQFEIPYNVFQSNLREVPSDVIAYIITKCSVTGQQINGSNYKDCVQHEELRDEGENLRSIKG